MHAFDAGAVARELGLDELADLARPCGLFVGNTRRLWPLLRAARSADPQLAAASDPIDRYTEDHIGRAAESLGGIALFAHRRYGQRFLPFQRLAAAVGVAALAPTQLLVHPTYGPWFAVRAVILHPGTPAPHRPAVITCICDGTCEAAFERARSANDDTDAWRLWLAARDACTVGREHRYDDAQLAYHYTKDPRFLDEG